MNIQEIKNFYEKKEDAPCKLTQKLIRAGYQQTSGGYIRYAKKNKGNGIIVDFREAEPNQWWHLIKSYCDNRDLDSEFTKRIQCGELIFWMAEVANCVDEAKLGKLVDDIIASGKPIHVKNEKKPNVIYDRRKWNREIQKLCFDRIVEVVETCNNQLEKTNLI